MTDEPHGQHIEREALYNTTGLTTKQRDELIWKLSEEHGWTQRQIGKKLHITQGGVSFALKRMRGEQRNRAVYDVCDACADTVTKDDLTDGLCPQCLDDLQALT